jgi:hypothetical protein
MKGHEAVVADVAQWCHLTTPEDLALLKDQLLRSPFLFLSKWGEAAISEHNLALFDPLAAEHDDIARMLRELRRTRHHEAKPATTRNRCLLWGMSLLVTAETEVSTLL